MMKKLISHLTLVPVFSLTSTMAAAGMLDSGFTAVYEVSHKSIYLGDATRTFSKVDANRWRYQTVTETKGLASLLIKDTINESTIIQRTDQGIQPIVYEYKQTGGKKTKQHTLSFDWVKLRLDNSYQNKTFDIQPGTQDLLSFQLQIMQDLQAGKTSLNYTIADKKRIDTYPIKNSGTTEITTPMKSFQAIELVSDLIRGKAQYKVWCVPELEYFPVRILKIDDDGDETDISLKSIRFNKP